MKITLEKQQAFSKLKGDSLILPWFYNEKKSFYKLPAVVQKIITSMIDVKEFSGRHQETAVVHVGGSKVKRIVLVGLGKKEKLTCAELSQAIGAAVMRAKKMHAKSTDIVLPEQLILDVETTKVLEDVLVGIRRANYTFTQYKTKKDDKSIGLSRCTVQLVQNPTADEKRALTRATAVSDSTDIARDIANADSVDVTPEYLATLARDLTKKFTSLTTRVLTVSELEEEKCGGILAVGRGSQHEPRLIVLEYNNAPKGTPPTAFVGKAITFDTGGISIKPWKQMEEMRFDMCGGAAVFGLMRAVAAAKLPVHLVGIIAAAENMPSHNAYKPGDVVKMADGTTVEVISTDAEGRMVLADALVYARRYKPELIVDLATLTGAVIATLGGHATGMFTDDDALADVLDRLGDETGDKVWRLPLVREWKKVLKSPVADMRNHGDGKVGGASVAGLFLQHFVQKKTPWAHLDIAGTAWNMSPSFYMEAGATGAGIPLLFSYLEQRGREE